MISENVSCSNNVPYIEILKILRVVLEKQQKHTTQTDGRNDRMKDEQGSIYRTNPQSWWVQKLIMAKLVLDPFINPLISRC